MGRDAPEQLKDKQGAPIAAFGPYHDATATASITSDTAVSLAIPANTKFYELASVIPCYVNAEATATASSAVFPAGVAIYKVLPGQTVVSMKRIGATDTGPVTLTPLG